MERVFLVLWFGYVTKQSNGISIKHLGPYFVIFSTKNWAHFHKIKRAWTDLNI